ncbi:DeoR family transcriptional regulator [Cytobacillus purgationiresistens]|uniref:DeoR/GlpR family transcriptional regulator of sugar metabolism n=1 Tax=Cytobacillus purgationiresistens TaxID=863449 RepID=A0ABU0AGU0_9BACI|nr:DeoR family transcriptional regulator [Cytobacillus purgationiresistens]MDQ0270481.1 DeoR/GlpR family transcriptional regulator of sugar metabolism [Cytobacillus purgationiresistens]
MLPIERQQQILTWLEKEETMKVSEVSRRLNVSEMTIYRDIKQLVDQKKILKTPNGITYISSESIIPGNHCAYCYKEAKSRQSMQIIRTNHTVEQTCCPHCGLLRYDEIEKEVSQIICHDFLYDTTISAKVATFLLEPEINLNCCQPQVIAFESIKQATQFQKGFGGRISNFNEAIRTIKTLMQGKTCKH